jgi:hypothetical protein
MCVGVLSVPRFLVQASQELPASPWYTLIWLTGVDSLHWVNLGGEQAQIPRPKLPDEAAVDSNPRMLVSPDGSYMALVARLNSGRDALGFYSFANGNFFKVHIAQEGETIVLGKQTSYALDGSSLAVGFWSGDYDKFAWRVIVFTMQTGDALQVLNSTDPGAPALGQLAMPYVVYYQPDNGAGTTGDQVHFQLIPIGIGGGDYYPAFEWSLNSLTIADSGYGYSGMDILPPTGEILISGVADGSVPLLEPDGPFNSHNMIGRLPADPVAGTPLDPIVIDGSVYMWGGTWVKGGEWIVYRSSSPSVPMNLTLNDQAGSNFPFPPEFTRVYGTDDGYVFAPNGTLIYYTNGATTATAPLIFTAKDTSEIVYVTPIGANFALTKVADTTVGVSVGAASDVTAGCTPSLAPRLTINGAARVTLTDGTPLRVRTEPGGQIITELAEGTVLTVLDGPKCFNNMNWWQVRLDSLNLVGWSAEGDTDYFLEPWSNSPSSIAVQPTATPTPPPSTTILLVTPQIAVNPNVLLLVPDGNCQLAPAQNLRVSMSVLVRLEPNSTLAVRTNVTDATPFTQMAGGTRGTIIEGPQCHQGYRFWKVTTSDSKITGWVVDGNAQNGYVLVAQ